MIGRVDVVKVSRIEIFSGGKNPATEPKAVRDRLSFAGRRLEGLKELSDHGGMFTELLERQQLVQEFFFHLVGAVDFLAQVVNTRRGIGLDVEDVEMWKVCQAVQDADPIKALLSTCTLLSGANPARRIHTLMRDNTSGFWCSGTESAITARIHFGFDWGQN